MDRHYSPLSRILHWLGAMAVIVMLTLGFMMFFADSREVKHFSEAAHLGVGFFCLLINWLAQCITTVSGVP